MSDAFEIRDVLVAIAVGEGRVEIHVVFARQGAHRRRFARPPERTAEHLPGDDAVDHLHVGGQGVIGLDFACDGLDLESRCRRRDDDAVPHLAVRVEDLPHLRT